MLDQLKYSSNRLGHTYLINVTFCNSIKNECFRNNAVTPMTHLLLTSRLFVTGNFMITAGDFSGVSVAADDNNNN